jgi:hypothetical protein
METTPRKRRHLLRALAETPVLPHRSASLASPSQRPTLGALVRRDPVYAPPTPLLARLGTGGSGDCAPPRRSVLVATAVEHPAQARVSPLLGARALHPRHSAANLLHQVLRSLWSLDDIPVAEVPESGALPRADGESCGSAEQRPARSSAPLESQVPPPEEVVEVAEPPQAEARHPQTCERPCGPVSPGARALAAKTGRIERPDPRCGKLDFESQHTPFAPERPSERGKGGQSCPCVCVCTRTGCPPAERHFQEPPRFVVLDAVDAAMGWLARCGAFLRDLLIPDYSAGVAAGDEFVGTIAVDAGGGRPALEALRGGQSQGLGLSAGLDLDLGVMRPALTLAALATSGVPERAALAPPEIPGGEPSFLLSLSAEDLDRLGEGRLS